MNCSDVDELIGAYAMDALDEADTQAVREHLLECAVHAAEARDLRSTAARLAATAEPMAPPPDLRSRILRAVEAAEPAAAPVDITVARERRRPYPSWYLGAAAAAALIMVGLVAWNIVLLNRGGGNDVQQLASRAQIVTSLQAQNVEGGGVVLYFPDEKKALVVGDGMTPLDPARSTYQLWEIDGGQPRSIGLMQADRTGHAVTVVPFEGGQGQTLAITVEPPGGSEQPTTQPIFTTNILTIPIQA